MTTAPSTSPSTGKSATLVALGILLSRISGLVRERIFAHYFGNSDAADVFKAALRIPNFLQNLFGEGVLSASFIPVYAKLKAQGRQQEATSVALAVGLCLLTLVGLLVLLGMSATPYLIDGIAPGFEGSKRLFAIQVVRVLFPGVGLLVLSAWCLGVLNSHGKFFLSYSAPVLWNVAIIAVLVSSAVRYQGYDLAVATAWGVVLGSLLQTLIQIPATLKALGSLKLKASDAREPGMLVLRNFGPVVIGRGVVQISAYIDGILASLLPTGAVAALAYAQTIYLLPVSLFGMSISAAELPAMASTFDVSDTAKELLRKRLDRALRRIAFFVIPSAVAFIFLGDAICQILFRTGRFNDEDGIYVWSVLGGSAVGLLAATMGRLYASAFYAMHDAKTPLRCALLRVLLTLVLGYFAALYAPALLHIDAKWGVAGLSASAGVAGWIEFLLLRRNLWNRVGKVGVDTASIVCCWGAALFAATVAVLFRFQFGPQYFSTTLAALILFGLTYVALTTLLTRLRILPSFILVNKKNDG